MFDNKRHKSFYKYLYDTYYASLCHYAGRFIGDIADEEDVVQDIFIKLWEQDKKFEDIEFLKAYLYRAVHNACITIINNNRKNRNIDVIHYQDEIEDSLPDKEELLIEEEFYRQVFNMIKELPKQRYNIMMLALEGKKNEEIARKLGISVNTVKTLKKKIYSFLREKINSKDDNYIRILLKPPD